MFPSGLQGTMLGFLVVLLAGDIPVVGESVASDTFIVCITTLLFII